MSWEGQQRRFGPGRASFWLAMGLCVLGSSSALAQEIENGIRVGEGRVHPYFDLDFRYDSAALLPVTGVAQGDFVAHFRPGFRLEVPASWVNLNFSGDVDWVQYTQIATAGDSKLSHLEANANLDADFNKSGAVEFDIGDTFSQMDRTSDPLIGLGVLSLYNEAHAALPIHPGGGALEIRPSAALFLENLSPLQGGSSALVSIYDYLDYQGGLSAKWLFLPKTAVVLEGTYDARHYSDATQSPADASLLHAQIGLVGLITSRLAVTAKVGWAQDFNGHNFPGIGAASGAGTLLAHAELNWLISDTSNVKIGYLRDLLAVPQYATYVDDRGYLEARFLFGGRLTLRGYAAGDYLQYSSNSSRNDWLATIDVGPQYQFTRWFIAALGYQLFFRSSNASGTLANYTENIGYVRLTFTY